MKTIKIAARTFDEWAEMASQDPATFEKMRIAAIEQYIGSMPAEQQERLRRVQWRVDQERRLARTPMQACIRISRMMWESVSGRGGLRDHLLQLQGMLEGAPSGAEASGAPAQGARIVRFGRGSG